MLRLVVTHGQEEMVFAVPEGVAKLGSARENDIVLGIPGVSRRHALVRLRPGGIEVVDSGSKNGLLVQGQRVQRAFLTPGLRVQIGAAWLEIEEVSTSEEALVRMHESSSERSVRTSPMIAIVEPDGTSRSPSPEDEILALAFHIAQQGVGLPEKRTDLLVRIKATLRAEAFATIEKSRSGRLRIWESVGKFSSEEAKLFSPLAGDTRITARDHVILKRSGKIVLAGRDSWFLAAKFPEESLAREGMQKEFLRFLASQFFMPVRSLDDVDAAEASRVFSLARGNVRRAATLLAVSPGKLYALLKRVGLPKRWAG